MVRRSMVFGGGTLNGCAWLAGYKLEIRVDAGEGRSHDTRDSHAVCDKKLVYYPEGNRKP